MGPMDVSRPWRPATSSGRSGSCSGCGATVIDETTGASRVSDAEPDDETLRLLHRTIDGVRTDFARAALQHGRSRS